MRHRTIFTTILFLATLLATLAAGVLPARAGQPVVHAVLFYSPTCSHCHKVMTESLPPIEEKYGSQLVVLKLDTTVEEWLELYQTAVKELKIGRVGVPTLIVGTHVLIGEVDIPGQLPGIIEQGLSQGGIDWPAITGMEQAVTSSGMTYSDGEGNPVLERFARNFNKDVVANTRAVIVLAALIVCLVLSLILALRNKPVAVGRSWFTAAMPLFALLGIPSTWGLLQTTGLEFSLNVVVFIMLIITIAAPLIVLARQPEHPLLKNWHTWIVPVLVLAGVAVAGYMTFIEVTGGEPVCGPVGDCASVQHSPYATLLGFLSVGELGLAGYVSILGAWIVQQFGPAQLKKWASLGLWAMGLFGVLFSSYLTFLEPFVIGATCMWCINSAVLMILLLWVITPGAQQALAYKEEDTEEDEDQVEALAEP